ncbi:AAA family ATPase [Pantanalinema rosaneae CENA516]|uniref:AAA family ATPase n=1 Tax=Pantanalinema rosaneae TaxID=1620701 RepID=UPI003D700CD6
MLRLLILIGLPGSGKSTLAAKLVQVCPDRRLISTDAIRAQLFSDAAIQGPWLKVWAEVGRQFRETVQQIDSGDLQGAIYDATNVVRRQRRQAIALAQEAGFTHITGLWLDVPLSICLQRNAERDRQVPAAIMYQMQRRLMGAPPSMTDGFHCLITLEHGYR